MLQLNSKNQSVLVLSDVHQNINKLEKVIKSSGVDQVVMLGDMFDTHHKELNTDKYFVKTCEFIKNNIVKDNYHFFLGNHDLQYFYSNFFISKFTHTTARQNQLDRILGDIKNYAIKRFNWVGWIDDRLISHAGINYYHIPAYVKIGKPGITKWLDDESRAVNKALENNQPYWMFIAGRGRGGPLARGGIVWQDFNSEFSPIEGIPQIVGHTNKSKITPHPLDARSDKPQLGSDVQWLNLDIDCDLNEWLIINNGKVTINKYSDL